MNEELVQKAIYSALKCDWDKAIEINEKILKLEKDDTDALNRLSRAYAEIGNIVKAKKISKRVLTLEPNNQIAKRSLEKYKRTKRNLKSTTEGIIKPSTFLEDPGRTKIVQLLNLGDKKVTTSLDAGDKVLLTTHSHRVCVTTTDGKYLGKIPDDLAARIKTLVEGGNEYVLFIKSIEQNCLKVFIKEIKRGKDFINTTSFPAEKMEYISYAPPELVNKDVPEVVNNDPDD